MYKNHSKEKKRTAKFSLLTLAKNKGNMKIFTIKPLCCSRKYPCPSHGRFFELNSPPLHPSGIPFILILSFKKLGFWNPPSPLEFPLTFHGVDMYTLQIQCKGAIDSNFTSLSSHFLTMMSSPVMSLIVYIMFVADSCASRITPTIATLKKIQQA